MKTKTKRTFSFLMTGIALIILSIVIRAVLGNVLALYFGEEGKLLPTFSTIISGIGVLFVVIAIIIAIVKNSVSEDTSVPKDPRLNHKGVDKTKNFATAEFVAAHKIEDDKYVIRFEYSNQDKEIQAESKPIYSYLDAKYFQKIKRFTVCYNETESYIYDEPRPGMIPELANAPIVPNEKVATKIKTTKKQETDLVRMFCSYCDCAVKPNTKKCPHCSAPIRKSK